MFEKKFTRYIVLFIGLLLAACNSPTPTPPPPTAVLPPLTFKSATDEILADQTFLVFCHIQPTYNGAAIPPTPHRIHTNGSGQADSWPENCNNVVALQRQETGAPGYDVYVTSWDPGTSTTQDASSGTVFMTEHLLIVFNPIVSLAWEPAAGSSIMSVQSGNSPSSLMAAFTEASRYLYEATNGQMIFGNVQVYTNGEMWDEADFRVLADNDRRPSANVGGMVKTAVKHTLPPGQTFADLIFYPGHITLGRGWSNSGPKQGRWSAEDGWRTLTHEWGHYAFFLYDEYLTLDNKNASCQCAHDDTACISSIMDWHYATQRTELWQLGPDNGMCLDTQQWQVHQKDDWQTVANWFEWQQLPSPSVKLQTPIAPRQGTDLTFASYLVVPQATTTALAASASEPMINVVASAAATEQPQVGQLLAQVYTVQHERESDVATSILYQGSSMLYPISDEEQIGQLVLLSIPKDPIGISLSVGVNQFIPATPYQVDAFSYTNLLQSTNVAVSPNAWNPYLTIQYSATMADPTTQTAVIEAITLLLELDEPTNGPVLAQLCTPVILSSGSKCHGPWEVGDGSPGQHRLSIPASELGIDFPSYSLLRLWVQTGEPTGNPELIRWLEIGRAGSGPGGGCAHAPLTDGNQTRTLGMNTPTNWDQECSGLVAYMPIINDRLLQTAVPNNVQGFVTPPVQIQDIPLENATCSATQDSTITLSYDDLDICQTAALTIIEPSDPAFDLARNFWELLINSEGNKESLAAACVTMLNENPDLEEKRLGLIQLNAQTNEWDLVRSGTVVTDSNLVSGMTNSDGIFAIVLTSN